MIANTGDDMWLHGVRVCPDLDTLMYTLGGAVHEEQGWGRRDESRRTSDDLAAYGLGWEWFTLGDLDLATHLARTALLRDGLPLSQVTARLAERWAPGVTLLPMTDDEVETHVVTADGRDLHFEEWWVRHRAALPAARFVQTNLATATPAPGVLAAIARRRRGRRPAVEPRRLRRHDPRDPRRPRRPAHDGRPGGRRSAR